MWTTSGSRNLQLWSDGRGKEFAVKVSNEAGFKAASNPAAEYTNLVDEAEYFDDMKYDWQFLLNHWTSVMNGSIKVLNNDGREPPPLPFDLTEVPAPIQKPKERRARREKVKPLLKCHYCKLSYNTEKERRYHELFWHSDKMKDSGRTESR